MKILRGAALPVCIFLAAAVPAGAVTYTTSDGAPDPGLSPGQLILVNFDDPLPGGYSLSGDFALTSGSTALTAAPAGDGSKYLYTSPLVGSGIATLSTFELSSVSFYWGSIDDYNAVDVLGAGGVTLLTLAGAQFSPADGNRNNTVSNQRVFFTAETGEVITGLRFHATGIAYEIDDVAGTVAGNDNGSPANGVPEPATWVLTIAGFGMIGIGARRRRAVAQSVSG